MPSETPTTDKRLEQWIEDEKRVRARTLATGVTPPAVVASRSGLAFMRDWLEGRLPPPPIGDTLSFLLIEVGEGRVVFQGQPAANHYNPLATVHGGWIAAILDSALGCAVHTTLAPGKAYTTAELKVNYVRAVTPAVGLLRAEGKVIHKGGRMATADARLEGPDGRLYAHASTTCFIFGAPSA